MESDTISSVSCEINWSSRFFQWANICSNSTIKTKKKTLMVGILVELLFTQNRSVREKCPYLEFLRSECLPQVTIVAFCNNIIQ